MGVVQPAGTNSLSVSDYELGKFVDLNGGTNPGTVAVRVVLGAGGTTNAGTINAGTINAATINTGTINAATINAATINAGTIGYPEGSVYATLTGEPVVYRGTGGTLVAVGTANPLPNQEQYAPGYEDNVNNVAKVEERFSYIQGTAAATVVVKGSAGFVHGLNILGGVLGAITVYDHASSTAALASQIIPTFTPAGTNFPMPTILIDSVAANGIVVGAATTTIWQLSYR